MTHENDSSRGQSKSSAYPQNSGKHKIKLEDETFLLFNALYNNSQSGALFQTT